MDAHCAIVVACMSRVRSAGVSARPNMTASSSRRANEAPAAPSEPRRTAGGSVKSSSGTLPGRRGYRPARAPRSGLARSNRAASQHGVPGHARTRLTPRQAQRLLGPGEDICVRVLNTLAQREILRVDVNGALVLDGVLDAAKPEIVICEPLPNGRLRMIGADFLVFAEDWHRGTAATPELTGQLLHLIDSHQSLRAARLLHAARVGVEAEPGRGIRELAHERVVRRVHARRSPAPVGEGMLQRVTADRRAAPRRVPMPLRG